MYCVNLPLIANQAIVCTLPLFACLAFVEPVFQPGALMCRLTGCTRGLTVLRRYYRSYLVKALLVSSRSTRWLLLPAYLAAGAALWGLLQEAQPALWTLGYAACIGAVLVPAKMIEFRCMQHLTYSFECPIACIHYPCP